jgi:hypothetical protein
MFSYDILQNDIITKEMIIPTFAIAAIFIGVIIPVNIDSNQQSVPMKFRNFCGV